MKEYKMKINGNDYAVTIKDFEENIATVTVNGVVYNVEVEGAAIKKVKTPKVVQKLLTTIEADKPVAATPAPAANAGGSAVKSPLPGVILDVLVREGDAVKAGQKLMVLEAMKMENNIESDVDGVVSSIPKRKGDSVLEGDTLIVIG